MKCPFLSVIMAVVMHVFMSRYTDQTTLSDCTLRFYREKNVTFGFCNVSQFNGSDVRKSCRWFEFESKNQRFIEPVYGTISLTPYTDERGHQYYRGSCTMNTTKFTQNPTSTYRVDFDTTYQSIKVIEELFTFPVTTTSIEGRSRQSLSSTVSSVISNENSGKTSNSTRLTTDVLVKDSSPKYYDAVVSSCTILVFGFAVIGCSILIWKCNHKKRLATSDQYVNCPVKPVHNEQITEKEGEYDDCSELDPVHCVQVNEIRGAYDSLKMSEVGLRSPYAEFHLFKGTSGE